MATSLLDGYLKIPQNHEEKNHCATESRQPCEAHREAKKNEESCPFLWSTTLQSP